MVKINALKACAAVGFALFLFGGVQHAAAVPAGSPPTGYFRVLITKVVSNPSVTVTRVTIEKMGGGQEIVRGQGTRANWGYTCVLDPGTATTSAPARFDTVILADIVTASARTGGRLRYLFQTSGSGGEASSSDTLTVSKAARLSDDFALTIKAGVYPLGVPVRLATLQSMAVTVTVK